ncbi:hypothetical protein [Corynebacterium halotolerans]|uniref:hypothetical protein n=1 Tax=Corynebacterium halotolerans TaxID=225326 RepID=UPI003CED9B0A
MTPPEELFAPAPLRHKGQLTEEAEKQFRRSRTATLALLRTATLIGAVYWIGVLLAVDTRWMVWDWVGAGAILEPATWVWLLLLACCLLLFYAAYRHRLASYRRILRFVAAVYLLLVLLEPLAVTLEDFSSLEPMVLDALGAAPLTLLVLVLPERISLLVVLPLFGVINGVSEGFPLTYAHLVEAVWAMVTLMPYILLTHAARMAAIRIDRAATRQYREARKAASSSALMGLESRVLGFLHDQVLHYLTMIRTGMDGGSRADLAKALPTDTDGNDAATSAMGLPAPLALRQLQEILWGIDPGLRIEVPEEIPTGHGIPTVTLDMLGDAAAETLHNCLRHAPGAQRWARLEIITGQSGSFDGLELEIIDQGPGFRLEDTDPDRAGLRVSVLGRMAASPGGFADVDSSVAEGTRVLLGWHRDSQGSTRHVPLPEVEEHRNGFEIGRTLTPVFGVLAFSIYLLKGMTQDHSGAPLWFVLEMGLLAVALWAMVRGNSERLPLRETVVAVIAIYGFGWTATWEGLPVASDWPHVWYLSVFAVMCSFLAIRNRPVFALVLSVVGLATLWLLARGGPTEEYVTIGRMVVRWMMLVLPAVILTLGYRKLTASLAAGVRAEGERTTDLMVATTQRSYLRNFTAWLNSQLAVVQDDALPARRRQCWAFLLELRIRDAIRSPAFDRAETNRAVWRARERGTTVRLRDDRSDTDGADPAPQPTADAELHRKLREVLDTADGTVTARVLPVGRATYATILLSAEDDTGQPASRSIRIPADGPEPQFVAGGPSGLLSPSRGEGDK